MLYFIKGHISVIALGAGSIVFGIAIDYSLHIFNHYRHKNDIRVVIKDLALPLTIGSFTTIGGFFGLLFVKSELLHDLGLFTALSLVGASLCSLIILPHLIVSKNDKRNFNIPKHTFLDKLSGYSLEHNKYILFIILILTIVFGYTSQFVGFEADMMKMNYMPESLRKAESDLNHVNSFSLQSVLLVSEGKTLNGVLENNEILTRKIEELKEKGIIKKYSSISSFLISDSLQRVKINRWNHYWTLEKKNKLDSFLVELGSPLKFNSSAFNQFKSLLNTDFQVMHEDETNEIKKTFLFDYVSQKSGTFTVVNLIQVAPDKKQILYDTLDNYQNLTIIDKKFIANRFVEILNSDFISIALITSILVFIVLLLTYGRIELALVSFIPMFISWIWILGIMGIFGIQFNIINIILSALIFGLGDDYSLFILDGLIQEYKTGKKNLTSYKSSILLSSITTIAGLGVLIFAKHPALKSIAIISIIGMVSVVFISFILIPFLFNLIIKKRILKGNLPWTLSAFLKSAFAFCYFLLGCLLLTLIGIIFTKLFPFGKERGKRIFHSILSSFTWSLMYIMINVKKKLSTRPKKIYQTLRL
ncbi:MAG: MMPL family transporter [Bacteroidetes bacterium]|nr:MMPL family transporter [Bacteroidota bacterium]